MDIGRFFCQTFHLFQRMYFMSIEHTRMNRQTDVFPISLIPLPSPHTPRLSERAQESLKIKIEMEEKR